MPDIIASLTGMLNVPILIVGLLIGYVIKHLIDNDTLENKWIPVINICVGAILGCILTITCGAGITFESILLGIISGAVSCVASSGFYDAFCAFLNHKEIESEEAING